MSNLSGRSPRCEAKKADGDIADLSDCRLVRLLQCSSRIAEWCCRCPVKPVRGHCVQKTLVAWCSAVLCSGFLRPRRSIIVSRTSREAKTTLATQRRDVRGCVQVAVLTRLQDMSRRTSNQQKETKEEKRKRIQANLEAQERLKVSLSQVSRIAPHLTLCSQTFTLPVLGVVRTHVLALTVWLTYRQVALVIFVLIVIFSQVPGSTKIAPPPPPKSQ